MRRELAVEEEEVPNFGKKGGSYVQRHTNVHVLTPKQTDRCVKQRKCYLPKNIFLGYFCPSCKKEDVHDTLGHLAFSLCSTYFSSIDLKVALQKFKILSFVEHESSVDSTSHKSYFGGHFPKFF